MDYTYLKYKDVHTITNNSAVETLTFKVYLRDCDNTTLIKEGTILPSSVYTLSFKMDGIYSIILNDGLIDETLEDIYSFENTLQRIIDGTQSLICGCKKCNGCEECDSCEETLQILSLSIAYNEIFSPIYQPYLDNISDTLKCNLTTCVLSSINGAIITGKKNLYNLDKYLVSAYYLAFYYYDLLHASDEEEAEYIKTKYNFVVINSCMKKLGISAGTIDEIIQAEDMNVYYWQFDNTEDDISDLDPSQVEVLSGGVFSPFSEFEQGKYVSYDQVGRIIFAVKNTLVPNFNIYDDSQDDITNAFDSVYSEENQVTIFVSKIPYSFGTVYYKFKKVTYNV